MKAASFLHTLLCAVLGAMLAACASSASAPSPMVDASYARASMDVSGGAEAPAQPGAPAPPPPFAGPPVAGQPVASQAPGAPAPAPGAAAAKDVTSSGDDKPGIAQLLIFTGQLHLQVEREAFATTLDRVVDLAVEAGGYISRQDDQVVEVRVPSAQFRAVMARVEKLGEVAHRGVQVQDVTEEFHDLSVRLKSLKATRDRLEQFLERAKSIAEVLEIERELSRLNGQIDQIEGRMRFLSAQAAYSTLTVTLQAKPKGQVIVEPEEPDLPPPPQTIPLPIQWLNTVGLERLLQLQNQ